MYMRKSTSQLVRGLMLLCDRFLTYAEAEDADDDECDERKMLKIWDENR